MQDKNILLSQNIKIKLYRSLYTDYFKISLQIKIIMN